MNWYQIKIEVTGPPNPSGSVRTCILPVGIVALLLVVDTVEW